MGSISTLNDSTQLRVAYTSLLPGGTHRTYKKDVTKGELYYMTGSTFLIFTSPALLVVMSHKSKACSVFASQECLSAAHFHVGPCPCNQLNTKDADMEQDSVALI